MSFVRDLRYASRVLLKTPVATGIAVLALGLGIAADSAAFISLSSIVLNPLPYPTLQRVITVWSAPSNTPDGREPLSPANFLDLASQQHSFEYLAALQNWDANLTGTGRPQPVQAYFVSPAFFSVLGTPARVGRTFAGESPSSESREVVVSEGFWKSHLASSRKAIGQQISVNRGLYTVVGIMPDQFDYPLGTSIWAPLTMTASVQQDRKSRSVLALGLLKNGVGPAQAAQELAAIASRLERQYPNSNEGRTIVAVPLRDLTERVTNHFLGVITGAALFVLLLACTNVGNLQLARAATREKEIAVRAALGAKRSQIARELLAECVLLAAASTVVGLLLASWHNDHLKQSIPAIALRIVPGLRTMHVDGTVLLLTLAAAFLASALCSLPAIAQFVYRRSQSDVNDVLRGRGPSANPSRNRLRAGLIVIELALALILLVGAGLMVKTFDRLLVFNQGFDPQNLLTMQVALPATDYRETAQIVAFYNRALRGFTEIPSVQAAGVASSGIAADHLAIEGQPEPRPDQPHPQLSAINSGYLATMRIPLITGRTISDSDRATSPRVAVISESVARGYWPGSSPIGRKIRFNNESGWFTIVGVCRDVIEDWFSGHPAPAAYVSYAQFPSAHAMVYLRTRGNPLSAAQPAQKVVQLVDPNVPVFDVKTMERRVSEERSGVHAAATTMTEYAVIALLLALTGIYGVVSYFVEARMHDIGVHIALGATRVDVFKMVMQQTARLLGLGLLLGLPLAILLARGMSHVLYNVVNLDWFTFAVFAAVMVYPVLSPAICPRGAPLEWTR